MGYTYSFADNQKYGASDINNLISKIVTGGVAEVFYDGTAYNTSDLNAIAAYIAEYGVRDAASATLKVVDYADGVVKVCPGTAFMHDGATVTADSDGVLLEYTKGQTNYVYIDNKLEENNSIDFVCGLTYGGSKSIPLAEIDENGIITDTRIYCKGKLAGYQSDFNQTKIIEVPYRINADSNGESQIAEIDLGGFGYSRIFNLTNALSGNGGYNMGYCNLNNNTYYSVCEKTLNHFGAITDRMRIYTNISAKGDNVVEVVFSLDKSILKCTITAKYGKSLSGDDFSIFEGTAVFLVC